MSAQLSDFARSLIVETAFNVLAVAKTLKARGQGRHRAADRRQPVRQHRRRPRGAASRRSRTTSRTTARRRAAGVPRGGRASSCARSSASRPRPTTSSSARAPRSSSSSSARRSSTRATPCWCSARTSRPTCRTSSAAARAPCSRRLRQANEFRPDLDDVERFLADGRRAAGDLPQLAAQPDRRRRDGATTCAASPISSAARDVAVFSDEPYCHMVWKGTHHSLLRQPGMLDQSVAAYTFSKSYSMSGWRLGYAVASPAIAEVDRQDDQHVAVVRAADRAARGQPPRWSTTHASATR